MRLMEENSLQSSFPMLLIFWLISVFCIRLILVLSCVEANDTIVHQIIYMQIHLCMCEFRPFIELNIIHRFFILKGTPADSDKLKTPHISKETSFSADEYWFIYKILYIHPLPASTDPRSTNSCAQNDANNKPRKGPTTVAVCRHPKVWKG